MLKRMTRKKTQTGRYSINVITFIHQKAGSNNRKAKCFPQMTKGPLIPNDVQCVLL